jgi:diadenosine tetraphosphate (Ap4A) HIT family hydrolase
MKQQFHAPPDYICPICLGVQGIYHIHVFPGYEDDGFNNIQPEDKRQAEPEERADYAEKLKAAL